MTDPKLQAVLLNGQLAKAIHENDLPAIKQLLSSGASANVHMQEYDQPYPALIWAAEKNNEAVVSLLLQHKANPNVRTKKGASALAWAAGHGNIKLVKQLLTSGAQPDPVEDDGNTPLHWACKQNHAAVVELLLKAGANITVINGAVHTPLSSALVAGDHFEVVQAYIGCGADLDTQPSDGITALMMAALNNRLSALRALLEGGAEANLKTEEGADALLFAAVKGNDEIAELLLQHGANVNSIDINLETPLMYVSEGKYNSFAEVLLRHKADVNLQDHNGLTALMGASAAGNAPVVKMLLDHGAKLDYKNKDGKTAMMLAVINNHPQVVQLLQEYRPEIVADADTLETLREELNRLVGLAGVKAHVAQLITILKNRHLRATRGLLVPDINLHMIFTGNPGTGKTTVARLLARIYKCMGVLPKGHLAEHDSKDLIAPYVGQTGPLVQQRVEEALGGVLFIDEAYGLKPTGTGNDYAGEAVTTLIKLMEDHRGQFFVIMAGYPDKMAELLESNPGFPSRFPRTMHFEDYSAAELITIFNSFANASDYKLSAEAMDKAYHVFHRLHSARDKSFGNARTARNIFVDATNNQAERLSLLEDPDNETLKLLLPENIPHH